jgi:prepilin-type N-terminal cleavage/methylation domain-containing protein
VRAATINRMSFRPRPLRSAFTLVELIVVVIVLGLLLAVALPNFFGASTAAQDPAPRSSI